AFNPVVTSGQNFNSLGTVSSADLHITSTGDLVAVQRTCIACQGQAISNLDFGDFIGLGCRCNGFAAVLELQDNTAFYVLCGNFNHATCVCTGNNLIRLSAGFNHIDRGRGVDNAVVSVVTVSVAVLTIRVGVGAVVSVLAIRVAMVT